MRYVSNSGLVFVHGRLSEQLARVFFSLLLTLTDDHDFLTSPKQGQEKPVSECQISMSKAV